MPRDRVPMILEQIYPAWPLPPLNISCSDSFVVGSFDIRWTNPAEIPENSKFNIVGVNVYRSFDSEYGPYTRLTPVPVGIAFYRDKTSVNVTLQENVSDSFIAKGPSDPAGKYIFKTRNYPIVPFQALGLNASVCNNLSVFVTVNNVQAYVEHITPMDGTIELRNYPSIDPVNQTVIPPVVPKNPNDVVLASYKYESNIINTKLDARVFYRLTTVAFDSSSGQLIETPLDWANETNSFEIEKLDWIWREAIRRNQWILDQGGERVKLFIKKFNGSPCGCMNDTYRQPDSSCLLCYGTGIIGGYEGPYDIVIAPDDADRNIKQTNRGRSRDWSYETWTGPSPLVSQRDFIVKLNGDRFGIGPVRIPSNRGMLLQQHFTINSFDEADIRFKVPSQDPAFMPFPVTRWIDPNRASTPMMTNSYEIPDTYEQRGNTVTYENHLSRGK